MLDGRTSTKVCDSPAGADVFDINSNLPLLSKEQQDEFHSTVARLLYLSKRARPDILLPVSFLTTRVRKATEQDQAKLNRVLDYLSQGHRALILGCAADGPKLEAYVDASHATHADRKGHTGAIITLGRGAIYASSSKQKTISRSSFEAEVNAASFTGSTVIWLSRLMGELGYNVLPTTIYQDNEGTASILRSGRLTGRNSKHIDVHMLWMAEKVTEGMLAIKWIPTEEMLADVLTKGMVGKSFQALRDLLMGN
jgi:hypothetical protein